MKTHRRSDILHHMTGKPGSQKLGKITLIAIAAIGLLATAFIVLVVVALSKSVENPERIYDPYLEMDEEARLDRIEKDLLERARKNETKRCPRPVPRGEPIPGSAIVDMRAVIEGESPCTDALEENKKERFEALFSRPTGRFEWFPDRHHKQIRPLSDPDSGIEGLDELLKKCAPSIERLRTATRHEDACGPYLPGVRPKPESYGPFIRLTTLMIAKARIDLEEGRWEDATLPMLDIIRFGQDMHRGGGGILDARFAEFTAQMSVAMLESILSDPREIPPEFLEQIEVELTQLIETEPHPLTFLKGDNLYLAIYGLMPIYKGPDWSPPGGRSNDFPKVTRAIPEEKVDLNIPRKLDIVYQKACPESRTAYSCASALKKFSRKMEDQRVLDEFVEDIEEIIDRELPYQGRRLFRQSIRSSISFNSLHVILHGRTRFRLGALRLAARYRALSREAGHPLGYEAFFETPLDEFLVDPYSGKDIRIEELSTGDFTLSPPVRIYPAGKRKWQPSVYLSCGDRSWRTE